MKWNQVRHTVYGLLMLTCFSFLSLQAQETTTADSWEESYIHYFHEETNTQYILSRSGLRVAKLDRQEPVFKHSPVDLSPINADFPSFKMIVVKESLYLVHGGGGVVFQLEEGKLQRIDKSFYYRNQFSGDLFVHENKLFHMGGYGLFESKKLLSFFNEGREWSVVTPNMEKQLEKGLTGFVGHYKKGLYTVLGGRTQYGQHVDFNDKIYQFDFQSNGWKTVGFIHEELRTFFRENPLKLTLCQSGAEIYLFDRLRIYVLNIAENTLLEYQYPPSKELHSYGRVAQVNKTLGTIFFQQIDHDYSQGLYVQAIPYTSLFNPDNFVLKRKLYEPFFSYTRFLSLTNLTLVFTFLLVLYMIKSIYQKEKNIIITNNLVTFDGKNLYIQNSRIDIDRPTIKFLQLLVTQESASNTEIVQLLAEDGLSRDYCVKLKNKIIDTLNDRFRFITKSNEQLILVEKSTVDKRIHQVSLNQVFIKKNGD